MEVKGGHNNKSFVCLFEFIGTAMLLFAINVSTETGMAPWGAGLSLMGSICIFGQVSGGHFNPAITLAVLIAEGKEKFGDNIGFALMIMGSQIIGAFVGCGCAFAASYSSDGVGPDAFIPAIAFLAPYG